MIFDNIKNCKTYYGLNPKFEIAFDFIKKALKENLDIGKYEIDGKDIYASIEGYNSKLKENSVFEGHENYIDIHFIMEGYEMIGSMEIANAIIKNEYDPEKDIAFYEKSDIASYCVARQGDFCIFHPHDIHSPGVAFNNIPLKVKKIVVKIHI